MRLLVRERIFGIGDDYWIEDADGHKVFLVDGKAMRVRDTFELKDAQAGSSSRSVRSCSACATRC